MALPLTKNSGIISNAKGKTNTKITKYHWRHQKLLKASIYEPSWWFQVYLTSWKRIPGSHCDHNHNGSQAVFLHLHPLLWEHVYNNKYIYIISLHIIYTYFCNYTFLHVGWNIPNWTWACNLYSKPKHIQLSCTIITGRTEGCPGMVVWTSVGSSFLCAGAVFYDSGTPVS